MTTRSEAKSPRVRGASHAILVLGVTLELIAGAGVGAFVGVAVSSPDESGVQTGVVMGIAFVCALLMSFAVASTRRHMREAERILGDAAAADEYAASVEALRKGAEGDRDQVLDEVRALRAELAELQRPWWRKVGRRAR